MEETKEDNIDMKEIASGDSKPLLDKTGQERTQSRWRYIYGVTMGVVGTLPQLGGVAFVQLLVQIPPDFELSILRYGAGLLLSALTLLIMRLSPRVQRENIKWILAIGVNMIVYNVGLYSHYLKRVPLVTLLCIHQAYKLVMSLILSRIFLRRTIPLMKCVVCLATFAGAMFTVVPRVEVYLDVKTPQRNSNASADMKIECVDFNTTNTSAHTQDVVINNNDVYRNEVTYGNDVILHNDVIHCSGTENESNVVEFIVALAVFFFASLASVIMSIIISETPLKDESVNVLTFWYFTCGLVFLVPATFILEEPFIPDNTRDILLCIGHALCAYFGNFFYVIANQIIEVNTLTVVTTARLPFAFVAEMTFLKDVVPVKRVYLLVIGTIITSLTTVAMPVYEIWFSKQGV